MLLDILAAGRNPQSNASETENRLESFITRFLLLSVLLIHSCVFTARAATLGYWRFEESGGNTVTNVAGNGYNGTLKGSAVRTGTVFGSPVPKTGQTNTQSLQLNGNQGDAADMGNVSTLDVGANDFTLEAWLNASQGAGFGFIAGKRISGLFGDKGYELVMDPSGASSFSVRMSIRAAGAQISVSTGQLNSDQWYHVAAVRNSSTTNLALYVNGVLVSSVSDGLASTSLASSQHFSVGGAIEGDGAFHAPFYGLIDEVRLSVGALAPDQFLRDSTPPTVLKPYISFQSPADGQTDVPAGIVIQYTLTDADTSVQPNSIQMFFNGLAVAPTMSRPAAGQTTIRYDPPGDLSPGSTNFVKLIYQDNGVPSTTFTNQFTFFVLFNNGMPSRFQSVRSGNLVVIEAENFERNLSAGGSSWNLVTTPSNYSGNGAMQALPDIGRDVGEVINNSPRMDFQVKFLTAGVHYLWVRGYASGASANWVLVGIDGQVTRRSTIINFPESGVYDWGNVSEEPPLTARVSVPTAGEHLISVWMSKDGFVVDKILLTTDPAYVPSNVGPTESARAPEILFARSGNQITLFWGHSGFALQANDQINNTNGWTDFPGGEVSPQTVNVNQARQYYRLRPTDPACDCAALQAAIDNQMNAGGGMVTMPCNTTVHCQSFDNPIEPSLQTKQSLLIREGVTLDLNGGTILIDPTETAHGIRLCSHSGIRNGTVRVLSLRSASLQSIYNSAISVGAAYGEGGTVQQPSYFSQITDWRIQDLIVDQPFDRSAIQVMSGSSQGIISNVTILPSSNAVIGIGFDWGSVGPLGTEDSGIAHMRELFEQEQIHSTHPHDIIIDNVRIGPFANNATDDSAGIRTSACYNMIMRNVTVYGARTGIGMRGGDVGFEFALQPDRGLAHSGFSISNFTLLNIRGKGIILDGLADNVYRAHFNYGYEFMLEPTYPGIKEASIKAGTIRGTSLSDSFGIDAFANSLCVFDGVDVQGFYTGARFGTWIRGIAFQTGTIAHNRGHGMILGISGAELGIVAPTNIVVTGSSIFRNGETVPGSAGVVGAMATNIIVQNNIIGSTQGAESQYYGIYVSKSAGNATVAPNTFGAFAPGGAPIYFEP